MTANHKTKQVSEKSHKITFKVKGLNAKHIKTVD